LLRSLFPALADVRQPLAGEIAARRDLLERMAFPCGYAVDVALLIDAWRALGIDGMAQVDADAVVTAILDRVRADGRLSDGADGPRWPQRPPVVDLADPV
jgi:hypothetical protein